MPNFPGRRGCTIGKYFQWVLVERMRVTRKKHKNLPRQFIFEDIKLEGLMTSVLKTHSKTPRLMNQKQLCDWSIGKDDNPFYEEKYWTDTSGNAFSSL